MKIKLTTLLFGLLLAVGWTSNAFAQSAVLKASQMEGWTYEWVDANGTTQTSTYINPTTHVADSVTDPYQIYGLLRAVYMDKRLPGPYYSAYTYNYQREDPVYYGGITGGWEIPYEGESGGGEVTPLGDIPITFIHYRGNSRNYQVYFTNIIVKSGDTEITRMYDTSGNINSGWSVSSNGSLTTSGSEHYFNYNPGTTGSYTGGTITISSELLQGYTNVQITITARASAIQNNRTVSISIDGVQQTMTSTTSSTYNWTVPSGGSSSTIDETLYKPNEEGYTALVVALYNDTTKIHDETNDPYDGAWEFTNKTDLINYIKDNISHVKLLTDGVRIGDDLDAGTVFNASGTYNRFFFLGKGQARKKSPRIKARMTDWGYPEYYCEEGPFKFMFEQFSPTTGDTGSDITDFYSEMMDGKVYNVVHDCASVIQNKHQFSMSGKKGTEYKALSGLNFFIPDYRLLYWYTTYQYNTYTSYTVDGRDMNPYEQVNQTTGARGTAFGSNTQTNYHSHWSVYYAQYNQKYAPKVGIYLLTLDAEAVPTSTEHVYKVNLDWTSSLNEMSGSDVDQTYTVYIVLTDENGVETLQQLVVTGQTHYDYTVPQNEHSYTITYIVKGTPADSEHPEFIAWSNQDAVVIPGWNDFLSLDLEHAESDFDVVNVKNYYRNFLVVDNENADNALTTTRIAGGENAYTLYRYDHSKPDAKTTVANLTFNVNTNDNTVGYTVAYQNQQIEDPNLDTNHPTVSYQRSAMGIQDNGTLSVTGNGDIVIQPSGYEVNFYSITVRNASNNNSITSWTASSTLPNTWKISNGSKFIKDNGTNYYYLEGGGYIRIPASVLNGVTNVNVVISASRDASTVGSIIVNESKQIITSDAATNYTWSNINTVSTAKLRATQELITQWVSSSTEDVPITDGWTLTPGDATGSSGLGTSYDLIDHGLWINSPGNITIPPSMLEGYSNISVEIEYCVDDEYTGTTSQYITVNGNQSSNATTTHTTYTWTNVDVSNGITITPRTGWINFYSIKVYGEETETPPTPVVEGMVRMGNLPILDQFSVVIPSTNDHPNQYDYVLQLDNSNPVKQSSVAEVKVQHTGAVLEGYYTIDEMDNDTDPEDFLTTDMLSAEVDMNLSPTSAPYYYTINSKKNGVPATAWSNYVNVLQRRGDGTYQEMNTKGSGVTNPYYGNIYPAGEFDQVDYRDIQADAKTDYLSYVPIVWTMGVDRRWYTTDSIHNSYGAPIWQVNTGDVSIETLVYERQAKNANGDWNPTVNWYDENNNACSLFMIKNLHATGVLPVGNVEYEPYMFRLWVICDGLRNMTKDPDTGNAVNDPTADRTSPRLLYTKYCHGANDLTLDIVKDATNWDNNVTFGGLNTIKPTFLVRFYYVVKGNQKTRAEGDDDHVGYVVEGQKEGGNPATAVTELTNNSEIVSKTYVNTQGMKSDKPFDGVNIVVTRFSDGTTTVSKVVK